MNRERLLNFSLLAGTLLFLLLVDRALLLYLGLPLWIADDELHYKHRPNTERVWSRYGDKPIIINKYGHHDHDFPLEKSASELRVLNLGDSITMGHGVTRDETYSYFLERILEADSSFAADRIQAINTGVQGYATFQEVEVLRRSLRFEPDAITVGFCLNDATEPFVVNEELGGVGLDYHRVTQDDQSVA